MAATVRVRSHHGASDDGGTNCDGLTLRLKTADNDTQNTSNQMVRPGGGTPNYSYIKQLQLYVQTAPLGVINNIKAYMTGTKPTGTDINVKANASYIDPTVQASTALTGTTSGYTYTATAPLSLSGSFTAATQSAPLSVGDLVEMQFQVINTATLGSPVSLGNVIFRYDES